jgi:hypothetical protein
MCGFLNIGSLDDHGYHKREFSDHDYISWVLAILSTQRATTA